MQQNPQVAVVMVVLSINEGVLKTALYIRHSDPFKGQLSLPAGLLLPNESLTEAAARVLKEKTGIDHVYLEQLHAYGEVKRDPVARTVGISYFAFVPFDEAKITEEGAVWMDVEEVSALAFDHKEILDHTIEDIQEKVLYSNIVHFLLPESFTLTQLQSIYEVILQKTIDKRNFRKKILAMDLLEKADNKVKGNSHRPAQLYKFSSEPARLQGF